MLGACSSGAEDGEPYGAVAFDTGAPVTVDQFLGGPVLLAGWATWCVPCERELPALNVFAASPQAAQLTVVAVNLNDASVGRTDIEAMLDRLDVTLPVWRDVDGTLLTRFGGSLMPYSVLLDSEGQVAASWVGAIDVDDDEFLASIAAVSD